MNELYAIGSVLTVSALSFVGVFALTIRENILNKILLVLVSFSAGALLGDAFLHLLPEATENGFTTEISLFILLGIFVFFILEKFIHWRHCHYLPSKNDVCETHEGNTEHKNHKHHPGHHHIHPLAYINLIGDGLHNFLDGVIIGGSFLVSVPLGLTTTFAVIMHEIPQEVGDLGVLIYSGMKKGQALLFNFLSALTSVTGTLLVLILGTKIETISTILVPFTAGCFIYIATADILPELQKETKPHYSLVQLIAFLSGIGMMVLLLQFE